MLDLVALLAAACFVALLATRSPRLLPHALALAACSALYLARVTGGPRVAVAAFAAWPGVAVALWRQVILSEAGHTFRGRSYFPAVFLAIYGLVLSLLGHKISQIWPWPLLLPNALPLLVALAWWRHPRTWTERAALVLPASCAADLVGTWSGAPPVVREVVGIVTWIGFAAACWCATLPPCARRPSADG